MLRTGCAKFGEAQSAQHGNYTTDHPAQQCQAETEVGSLKYIAAQIVNSRSYGHSGHKADAAEQADYFFKLTIMFLFFHLKLLSDPKDTGRNTGVRRFSPRLSYGKV